ncbi:MAG: sigma factor [Pseudomonadota bacterium]
MTGCCELQPDIRRYARRQCHRGTVIEDVAQQALIVVYRRVGNVRDAAALAGWIFRVVARMKQSKPGE